MSERGHPVEKRCDICQDVVPASPVDEPGESYSLANHRWLAHGIKGITRCEHCAEPTMTSSLADHLALVHDLPPPTHAQRIQREATRLRRDILEATEKVAESTSQIEEAIKDLGRRAVWVAGLAAIGFLVGGFHGAAVALVLVLAVVVIFGLFFSK